MADTENRNIDFKDASKESVKADKSHNEKKPHKKKSFAWWAGVIVLILISITFILPATGISSLFVDSSIEFGSYGGEPIEYANGSYMYKQYSSLYMQSGGLMDSASLLKRAYDNTVVFEALTQKAEEAGIYVSEDMINQRILADGYYNNEDGVFDESVYNAAGVAERTGIYNTVRDQLPYVTVDNDITTTLVSSDAEKEFVASMASNGRTFEYVAFDYTVYPEDRAVSYANSNPQPFTQINLSVISSSTQSETETILADAQADPASYDTALSEAEGSSLPYFFYELEGLGEENVNAVFSADEGSIVGPFLNGSSYDLYRIDSAPVMPDFTQEETLDAIREYININAPELITEYAAEAADVFYAAAADDYDGALGQSGLTSHAVDITAPSDGSSTIISSLRYTDSYGLLNSAASSDSSYLESLFKSEPGTVLAPHAAGNAYIVTRIGADEIDSDHRGFVETLFYDYVTSSSAQSDLQNAIFMSDKFEDHFLEKYLELIGASVN